MALGWIDFSQSERDQALTVLDYLKEAGTLDELGIAPIRDGFSNLFFPGTSTIQTRAKYFFLVPYILLDLSLGKESNPNKLEKTFRDKERERTRTLIKKYPDDDGIIGRVAIKSGRWVKRTPADIYWAGIRQYGIFKGGNMSLAEYLNTVCKLKRRREAEKSLMGRNIKTGEEDFDDLITGSAGMLRFWNIPTYPKEWEEWNSEPEIGLRPKEAGFLRKQIVTAFPNSMLAWILKHEMTDVLECESFKDLKEYISRFPEDTQTAYFLAVSFSDFMYVLRIIYNRIVSRDGNDKAIEKWDSLCGELAVRANVDLESIFQLLQIRNNPPLRLFLERCRKYMADGSLEDLKREIQSREVFLKGSGRAKTKHPEQYDPKTWYGGKELEYRFPNAKMIVKDIIAGERDYATPGE